MQQQTPMRIAIAGLSHDHVTWILRNWHRNDLNPSDCIIATLTRLALASPATASRGRVSRSDLL